MNTLFPNSMTPFGALPEGRHVAIIMRTKDRPVLLARALSSVLAQTHQNWRLYLVNDGGERSVVDRLCQTYETAFAGRISITHHDASVGMEAASNVGLRQSNGDFVAVHDDDDSWHPEFLQKTTEFLNSPAGQSCAAVVSDVVMIHEHIKGDSVVEDQREPWGRLGAAVSFSDLLVENNFPPICLLIRRNVVDFIGAFNASLPVLGDWDYNLRIMMIGDIGKVPLPLAYYHLRPYSSETNIYGNTVGPGQTRHELYRTYFANSMVRSLFNREPAYAGLLHVLLHRMEENQKEVRGMLGRARRRQAESGIALKKRKTLGQRLSREAARLWRQIGGRPRG